MESESTRSTPPRGDRSALVTGANGFIGSRIARRLHTDGWRVRAIVRAHDPSGDLEGVEQVVGDFIDPEIAREAAKGMRVVVHSAATGSPEREIASRVNVDGTRSMVGAAVANGAVRYVQISTGSVYRTEGLTVVDEDSPIQGEEGDPYGATKAEADRVVLAHAASDGLPVTILRLGAVQGVHPTSTWGVKIPDRIRTDPDLLLRPRARSMPWIHVEDIVDALLLALGSAAAVGRVYNLVDEHTTWGDYVDRVRSWFGLGPQPDVEPATPGAAWAGRFEGRRVREDLGYAPRRSYDQGMEEAGAYWRARLVTTGSV